VSKPISLSAENNFHHTNAGAMRWKVATKLLGKAENASINSRARFVGFVNQVVEELS
jgi:hypothetical protein